MLRHQILVEREDYVFFVGVEYEKLPEFCANCLNIGHSLANCKRMVGKNKETVVNQKVVAKYVPKQPVEPEKNSEDGKFNQNKVVDDGMKGINLKDVIRRDSTVLEIETIFPKEGYLPVMDNIPMPHKVVAQTVGDAIDSAQINFIAENVIVQQVGTGGVMSSSPLQVADSQPSLDQNQQPLFRGASVDNRGSSEDISYFQTNSNPMMAKDLKIMGRLWCDGLDNGEDLGSSSAHSSPVATKYLIKQNPVDKDLEAPFFEVLSKSQRKKIKKEIAEG